MISVVIPALAMNVHIEHNKKILMGDNRVQEVIVVEGVSPVSMARQEGLHKAKGRYILWIDADIEIKENPIDIFLEIFHEKREDKVAGVSGSSSTVPNTISNIFRRVHEDVNRRYVKMPPIFESTVCMLECGLFDREKMIKVGGFDRPMSAGEDNYITLKLNEKGRKCYKTTKITVDHYYDSSNLGAKQRNYGSGIREVKKIFGENYSIHEEYPTPNFKEKWILRIKVLKEMGKLHLLPLLPIYNLYVGQMLKRGMESESNKQSH